MEVIVFIGIQATGKSSFYKDRFFRGHVRINMDMLRTRHRETLLFEACLRAKQACVIDNTNPGVEDRRRYIDKAKLAGFSVTGYYFSSALKDALARNSSRSEEEKIPERGVLGCAGRLERPSLDEGFDKLYYVRLSSDTGFHVSEWNDEI